MCTIHIGGDQDFLALQIHGRTKPNSQDYWDANWLHSTLSVSLCGFRGTFDWQLRNEDLARFMRALEHIKSGASQAILDTGDGWLDVRLVCDHAGKVEAQGQVKDSSVPGYTFEFRLPLDERNVLTLGHELHEALVRYPILGADA